MKIAFYILQLVSALALIFIIMSQASKSEGLSGTLGGKTESAFQGKPGLEEKLDEITKWAAVVFMVVSIIVAYAVR